MAAAGWPVGGFALFWIGVPAYAVLWVLTVGRLAGTSLAALVALGLAPGVAVAVPSDAVSGIVVGDWSKL